MLSQSDIELLNTYVPFMHSLGAEERRSVLTETTLGHYPAGQFLHDGESCSGMIVLKSGQVRGFMESGGKEITLYRLLPGDVCVITASCVLKNVNFTILLAAERDCEIFVIPTKVFEPLNKNNIDVKDFVLGLMATRLSEVMWVMEQTVFSSFDKRLAGFLMEQSALAESDTLSITHEEIANHLGSAREVVTRMLRYFKDEGIVSISRGVIAITDYKKLRHVAD